MSIRIVPQEQLTLRPGTSSPGQITPLFFPHLKVLYIRRVARLRQLAKANPLADYLNFIAKVVQAQQHALQHNPLTLALTQTLIDARTQGKPPLDVADYPRSEHWHHLLRVIMAELCHDVPTPVRCVVANLQKATSIEWESMATALLAGQYAKVASDKALFIWAALSLYWVQMAAQLPGQGQAEYGEQRQFCPVCGSMPVASIIHSGEHQGLRYLHCHLCESEWHMVRVKCSNCEESRDLNYWSLQDEKAAVKAESCYHCGTYLKILYQAQAPYVDVVADDLATLILDAKMEEAGFGRSSINPFLFPKPLYPVRASLAT